MRDLRAYLPVLILVTATRLPFVDLGAGVDPDAWRNVEAFRENYEQKTYTGPAYTGPGRPLFEIGMAFLSFGENNWRAINCATFVAFLFSFLAFEKVARYYRVSHTKLLMVCYALTPILWVNSVNAMDYCYSVSAFLWTLYFFLSGRPYVAGVLFALTIGLRITYGIFYLPFCVILLMRWKLGNVKIQDAVAFILISGSLSSLLYVPSYTAIGGSMFMTVPNPESIEKTLVRAAFELFEGFGPFAVVAFPIVLAFHRTQLLSTMRTDREFATLTVMSVFLVGLLYLVKPHEPEYLLPVAPLLIILIGKIQFNTARPAYALVGSLLLYSVVNVEFVRRCADEPEVQPRLTYGLPARSYFVRKHDLRLRSELERFGVSPKSVLVAPNKYSVITTRNERCKKVELEGVSGEIAQYGTEDILVASLLSHEDIGTLRDRGFRIYYLEGSRKYLKLVKRFDIEDFGAVRIGLPFC